MRKVEFGIQSRLQKLPISVAKVANLGCKSCRSRFAEEIRIRASEHPRASLHIREHPYFHQKYISIPWQISLSFPFSISPIKFFNPSASKFHSMFLSSNSTHLVVFVLALPLNPRPSSQNWHSTFWAIVEKKSMITPGQFCIILKLPESKYQHSPTGESEGLKIIPHPVIFPHGGLFFFHKF
jgi:hypothetical protein